MRASGVRMLMCWLIGGYLEHCWQDFEGFFGFSRKKLCDSFAVSVKVCWIGE